VLHERGWGKRTSLDEFNEKGRYTQGNWATDHRRLDEIGPIVAARVVEPTDQITVMTANGIVLRTSVAGISRMGRSTRGVRVVNLQEGDSVAALAILTFADLNREIDGGGRDNEALVKEILISEGLIDENDDISGDISGIDSLEVDGELDGEELGDEELDDEVELSLEDEE
jgi:hypothetical protein